MSNPRKGLGINYSKQTKFWSRMDNVTATASKPQPTALIQPEAAAEVEGRSLQDSIPLAQFTLNTVLSLQFEMGQGTTLMSETTTMHQFAMLEYLSRKTQKYCAAALHI